jgi:dGTPase
VVELLEDPYPNFPGLNLTFEVREGLRKHGAFHQMEKLTGPQARIPLQSYRCLSLEAQVADLADEITYYSHDLDDAVDFEILNAAQLERNEVWRRSLRAVLARYPHAREPELHKLIIRDIIDTEVRDLVSTSAKCIADAGVQSSDEARQQPAPLIRYSDDLFHANRDLRKFLYQNVYYDPRVSEVNRRACEMLRQVFQAYLADPDKLGETAAKRIETEGLHRTVCDYIAGMTDRYLMEEHARIAKVGAVHPNRPRRG